MDDKMLDKLDEFANKLIKAKDQLLKDEDLERKIAIKKIQFRSAEAKKQPDPMQANTRIAVRDMKMKKEEQDLASPDRPKGLDSKKQPVTHDECGRPFEKDEKEKKIKQIDTEVAAESKSFLNTFNPKTKHPAEATAGMPEGKKIGQRNTPTGFQLKMIKADLLKTLDEAGYRESALLLKNWDELDKTASTALESLLKSNYGPKDMDQYDAANNAKRKQSRTGETLDDIGKNKGVRNYTTSGSSAQQANETAQQKAQNKKVKNSIKVYSPEELAEFAAARGDTVSVKKVDGMYKPSRITAKPGASLNYKEMNSSPQRDKPVNTLDYKSINKMPPKVPENEAPTIDYSSPKMKEVIAEKKPWEGSRDRRAAADAKMQENIDSDQLKTAHQTIMDRKARR